MRKHRFVAAARPTGPSSPILPVHPASASRRARGRPRPVYWLSHDPRDLCDVTQVMRYPGGQQLAQRHSAELRVPAPTVEIFGGEVQRGEPEQVCGSKLGEQVEELVQGFAAGSFEHGHPVERSERTRFAVGQQQLGAHHPIGPLTMNQMSHDVEGAPGIRSLRSPDPGLGQIPQQGAKDHRSPAQNRHRIFKAEVHS